MQHPDAKFLTNTRQRSATKAATTRDMPVLHNFSWPLHVRLAKSVLLPALLLCGVALPGFAQTGCTLQLTTAATNVECGNPGAVNLSLAGGTGPYTYAWTGPNGFMASTEDISGLAVGTYSVAVTDNTSQCTATASTTVTVITDTTPPVLRAAGFEVALINGVSTILADDVDYGSFDTCSGLASISVSPSTFTCANIGSNPVTFTATDSAGNTASAIVAVQVLGDATCLPLAGTAATVVAQRLQVYPNPAGSTATVAFVAEITGAARVSVYNSLGQQVTVLHEGLVQAGQEYRFPLQSAGFSNGVYICRVRTVERIYTTRLLIAN